MLESRVRAAIAAQRLFEPAGTAVVAVSGGADSMALLDLLHGAADDLDLALVAAHADHGIRPDSAAVAARVERFGGELGLAVHVGRLALGPDASETRAREARYRWLRAVQRETGARYLVTAHHLDDQIETVLLRVLKGSGLAGLAGMRPHGARGLRRPLLECRRRDLRAHAEARGLPFEDDPANVDPRHLRSWVRTTLVPILVERLGPEVETNLSRLARHAALDRVAWDRVLDALGGLELRDEAGAVEVARAALRGYDKVLSVAVLRALARRVGAGVSDEAARRLLRALSGPSGRRVELGGGWVGTVSFGRLRLERSADAVPPPRPATGMSGQVAWGEGWRLRWRHEPAPATLERAAWVTWVEPGVPLEWRTPAPGDRVKPLGGVGRRSVARLLMEAKVPRRERVRYPVLAAGAAILWIPGVCRADAAVPAPGSRAVRVDADFERVS